jgi:hypothetical protein
MVARHERHFDLILSQEVAGALSTYATVYHHLLEGRQGQVLQSRTNHAKLLSWLAH